MEEAEVIKNHENVRYIGQGETPQRKYKRLKLVSKTAVVSSKYEVSTKPGLNEACIYCKYCIVL
jgi:hypothetical protein